ncbi:hypothetical protein [Bacillus cereus]|uniref:hypothetical protein n=1 Tax=Bacillus cereus TaxID=1396 RepID=UPI001C8BE43F|nr:hypothetical protein [Bacillus cereus]MBX9158758.1 hypothetical protein [Bacillus cereus]
MYKYEITKDVDTKEDGFCAARDFVHKTWGTLSPYEVWFTSLDEADEFFEIRYKSVAVLGVVEISKGKADIMLRSEVDIVMQLHGKLGINSGADAKETTDYIRTLLPIRTEVCADGDIVEHIDFIWESAGFRVQFYTEETKGLLIDRVDVIAEQ